MLVIELYDQVQNHEGAHFSYKLVVPILLILGIIMGWPPFKKPN
jgi:hypothetical protein